MDQATMEWVVNLIGPMGLFVLLAWKIGAWFDKLALQTVWPYLKDIYFPQRMAVEAKNSEAMIALAQAMQSVLHEQQEIRRGVEGISHDTADILHRVVGVETSRKAKSESA